MPTVPPNEDLRERAIEAWMLRIIDDGGVARMDDLHIDEIDASWKSRLAWIPGAIEAFRLALKLRNRHELPFTVAVAFSLQSAEQPIGVDFRNQVEMSARLDWSPPSLYLFTSAQEPKRHTDVIVHELPINLLGAPAEAKNCYHIEFRQEEFDEYSRSVFLEG